MPDDRLALRILLLTLLANCGLSFMSCAQDVAHRNSDRVMMITMSFIILHLYGLLHAVTNLAFFSISYIYLRVHSVCITFLMLVLFCFIRFLLKKYNHEWIIRT